MSQKNETKVLVLSLLITAAMLGGGAWWFLNRNSDKQGNTPTQPDTPATIIPISPTTEISTRLSTGDKLLTGGATKAKQAAIFALATEDYTEAIAQLEASLQANRNDPEALIYLNNARIGNDQAHHIAVVIPASFDVNGAKEILRGIAQAQQEINSAGGINSIPLKILIADDNNDPELAKQVAQSLAENSDILGVVGHWASDVTLAAAEVYEQEKLVVISPVSTSVQLSGFGNYIFRTVPSDRFAGSALARYMLRDLDLKQAAVFFNSQSNYSRSLKEVFTTDLFAEGGEVVEEFDLSEPNFNAAEAFQQAKARDAQVLVLVADVSNLDKALQVVQVNDGDLEILAGDDVYSAKTLQIGGRDALGMVLAVPWHIKGNPEATFPQAARDLWVGDVNWRTAMAYDAAKALIAAIEKQPTRQGVQAALKDRSFTATGAEGAIRFLPSGDRNKPMQLVKVEEDTDNSTSFGYEFVPLE